MKIFIAKIIKKTLIFKSDFHRSLFGDFLKENEGKDVRIELTKNSVSDNLRGYYFGAIIPSIQAVIPEWKEMNGDDVHEILKKMFNYFECFNPVTKRVERFGRSAMGIESNTERASDFIEKIRVWFAEDYKMDLPSSDEYKKIRDLAGDDGKSFEDYPKLDKMPTI